MKEQGIKRSISACAFCSAKVIKVTESTVERRGKIAKKLAVNDGYFLIRSHSVRLPICSNCWEEMSKNFNPDPLRALLEKEV